MGVSVGRDDSSWGGGEQRDSSWPHLTKQPGYHKHPGQRLAFAAFSYLDKLGKSHCAWALAEKIHPMCSTRLPLGMRPQLGPRPQPGSTNLCSLVNNLLLLPLRTRLRSAPPPPSSPLLPHPHLPPPGSPPLGSCPPSLPSTLVVSSLSISSFQVHSCSLSPRLEMCQVQVGNVLQHWTWPLSRLYPTGLPGKEAVAPVANQEVGTAHQHHVGRGPFGESSCLETGEPTKRLGRLTPWPLEYLFPACNWYEKYSF